MIGKRFALLFRRRLDRLESRLFSSSRSDDERTLSLYLLPRVIVVVMDDDEAERDTDELLACSMAGKSTSEDVRGGTLGCREVVGGVGVWRGKSEYLGVEGGVSAVAAAAATMAARCRRDKGHVDDETRPIIIKSSPPPLPVLLFCFSWWW